MNSGICEIFVTIINNDFCPLFLATSIIYIGKSIAIIERTITNTSHAIRDYYRCKACATIERTTTNTCHAIADYYRCKACARERLNTNTSHAIRDYYRCKA